MTAEMNVSNFKKLAGLNLISRFKLNPFNVQEIPTPLLLLNCFYDFYG